VVGEADGETRLAALEEFGGLKQLASYFSEVTEGVAQLRKELPNCEIRHQTKEHTDDY